MKLLNNLKKVIFFLNLFVITTAYPVKLTNKTGFDIEIVTTILCPVKPGPMKTNIYEGIIIFNSELRKSFNSLLKESSKPKVTKNVVLYLKRNNSLDILKTKPMKIVIRTKQNHLVKFEISNLLKKFEDYEIILTELNPLPFADGESFLRTWTLSIFHYIEIDGTFFPNGITQTQQEQVILS